MFRSENRSSKNRLANRRKQLNRRKSRRNLQMESLEDRRLLAANLFIDYGDNFPGGTLTTTTGAFRDIANATNGGDRILGTSMDGTGGFNAAQSLDVVSQTFTTAERDSMRAIVERAYLGLDVNVIELTTATTTTPDGRSVSGATSVADVVTTLRGGNSTWKDAYVFVGTFIVDQGGANQQTYGNLGGGLSPSSPVLGETSDLVAASNLHDDVAVVYSNGGINANTYNNIAHEAGHLFGLQHAITNPVSSAATNLFHQAETMSYRNTNNTPSSISFTRYPMIRGDGNTPGGDVLNDYNDLAARTGDSTLHDQARTDANVGGNPNFNFVSGTGAHDIITIRRNGANADVTVSAFADPGYTLPITVPDVGGTTYSYSIPLNQSILVQAGGSNDRIFIDGDLGVDLTIDGMRGIDTLVVDGGTATTASYTPNSTTPIGVDLVTDFGGSIDIGTNTITFSNFEPLEMSGFDTVTFVSPNGLDLIDVDTVAAPVSGNNSIRVGGFSGGVAFEELFVYDTTDVVIDVATNDTGGAEEDDIFVDMISDPQNVSTLTVHLGDGADILTALSTAPSVTSIFNGDDGDDTFQLPFADDMFSNVTINGGDQTTNPGGDQIEIGGSIDTVTHTFLNDNDGTIDLSNNGVQISYTGLEPILDNIDAVNRVFTFTQASTAIELTTVGTTNSNTHTIIESPVNESVEFKTPSFQLTVNLADGTNMLTATSFAADYDPAVNRTTINGGNQRDIVNLEVTPRK